MSKTKITSDIFRGMLSSGSTMLNLACTDRPHGSYSRGKCILLVGDSSAGKTWFALTTLAEASINKRFDGVDLYYDNTEDGALMDVERYFGKRLVDRLLPPVISKDGAPVYSETVEDFYDNLQKAVSRSRESGRPFVYVLDSENALSSEAEQKKNVQQRTAREKNKDSAGSYGDAKAKYHSQHLRGVQADLRDTRSILIILCQTRDNVGTFAFEKKTRSGGRALKFYAALEIWFAIKRQISRTVRKKLRNIGILAEIRIKKNRITGKRRTVEVPIYHSSGMDDLGSCIDFLTSEGFWKTKGGVLVAPEFTFKGDRADLIQLIERDGREKELQLLAGELWNEIEEACLTKRKNRYS